MGVNNEKEPVSGTTPERRLFDKSLQVTCFSKSELTRFADKIMSQRETETETDRERAD